MFGCTWNEADARLNGYFVGIDADGLANEGIVLKLEFAPGALTVR